LPENPLLMLNRYTRPVTNRLAAAGEDIENGSFPNIGIAD